MAATALLKFTQGSNVGSPGQAMLGVTGTVVTIGNGSNTGVRSWQLDLVYVDPSSALDITIAYAFSNDGNTPTATFVPDFRGPYRWVLSVWDATGRSGTPTDVDIRVFAVPELNGFVVVPPQIFPLPLPDPLTGILGAKPNELNFAGQEFGWAGNATNDGLQSRMVRLVDAGILHPYQVATGSAGPHELCRVDSSKWDKNMYVRALFDVIVDNGSGTNFGYFNRLSIFSIDNSNVLVHKATGETVYSDVYPAPTDGAISLNPAHTLKVTVDTGRYIVVTGTSVGVGSPALDLVWKVSAQFLFSQR